MKRLMQVDVGWKYVTDETIEGKTTIHVRFPKVSFSKEDLKGKTKWSDEQFLKLALDFFESQRGFRPEQKDAWVERLYKGKVS